MANLLKTILEKLNDLGTKVEEMMRPTMEIGSTKKQNEVTEEKVEDAETDAVGENEKENVGEGNREPVRWSLF